MKKIFIILVLSLITTNTALAADSINFIPLAKHSLLMENNYPEVYKPSRLIIGNDTSFTIKADPGSNVLLAISQTNTGAPLFHGQMFNLGADLIQKEGLVPANGLIQLNFNLPNDKKLENKIYYFEVFVWKSNDFKDLKRAKIMAPNGRETDSNEITAILPPKNTLMPTFGPDIPGGQGLMKAVDTIEKMKKGNNEAPEKDYEMNNYSIYDSSVLLRNLNSPDANQGTK